MAKRKKNHIPLTAGSLVSLSLAGLCPQCHRGKIFTGYSRVKNRCPSCGYNLQHENSGDGPSAFLLLLIGFPAVFVIALLYLKYDWPFWALFLIFIAMVAGGMFLLLRPLKAMFIALQYYMKSE
ncbi:MAG: DUF983 domain-containing protein [Hydrotalea sp.]|nr:DUF983 domain-containing protein [Hydrotalea sp.]